MVSQLAFLQELGNDLGFRGCVEEQSVRAQTVLVVRHQIVQRDHHVIPGKVGGDVVRIGDAHIRRGVGGNICDDVVVNIAVIRVSRRFTVMFGYSA